MKKLLMTLSLVGLLAGSALPTALAETQGVQDVQVKVVGGNLSLHLPSFVNGSDVQSIALQENGATLDEFAKAPFTIKDYRGTQRGWKLTAKATHFAQGADTLPAGSIVSGEFNTITSKHAGATDATLPTIAPSRGKILDGGSVELASAAIGKGMGTYELGYNDKSPAYTIVLDGTTPKNGSVYQSTITWDLLQAP